MPEDMTTAPEVVVTEEFRAVGQFVPCCPAPAIGLYTAIWTEPQG